MNKMPEKPYGWEYAKHMRGAESAVSHHCKACGPLETDRLCDQLLKSGPRTGPQQHGAGMFIIVGQAAVSLKTPFSFSPFVMRSLLRF